MIPLSKFKWSIVVIVLHLIVLGYFAVNLPANAKVPMHWNINNEIDGWSGKTGGLIFIIKGFVLTNNYPFQQYSGALAFIILLYPLLHSFILFRKMESGKSF